MGMLSGAVGGRVPQRSGRQAVGVCGLRPVVNNNYQSGTLQVWFASLLTQAVQPRVPQCAAKTN